MKRRGKQTDLGSALDSLARRFDRSSKGRFMQSRIAAEWERVAGPSVAEHTTNAHLRDGELVVYVDSPVWATELSALAGPYKDALNEALGQTAVRAVRFAVSRKVATRRGDQRARERTDEFYRPDPTVPVPLTAKEMAEVEASLEEIADEGLRQAALKATVASMEWRKGQRTAKVREEPRQGL